MQIEVYNQKRYFQKDYDTKKGGRFGMKSMEIEEHRDIGINNC